MPHAVRELGAPPEMVGRCEVLYAPMPLRTTAFAVAIETLFRGYLALNAATFLRMVSKSDALNEILRALDLDAALPFLFFLLPLIRSDLGAGVCAALFLPLRFIYCICNFIPSQSIITIFVIKYKFN
jgi:hypothetical protein